MAALVQLQHPADSQENVAEFRTNATAAIDKLLFGPNAASPQEAVPALISLLMSSPSQRRVPPPEWVPQACGSLLSRVITREGGVKAVLVTFLGG